MIVTTATDRNYVEITGVMLRSLAANGGLADCRAVVLGDRLREADKRLLKAAAGGNLEVIDIGNQRRLVDRFRTTVYWPTAVYFRLLAPDFLSGAGRLLHLDGDTLVNSEIASLASLPMEGHPVATVAEKDEPRAAGNARLGRPPATTYFNSGVMLIDVQQWRSRDITGRVLRWLNAHPDVFSPDQDALNAVIGNDWLRLDPTYNSHCLPAVTDVRRAKIIHFTGSIKPMEAGCKHPAVDLYLAQRAHTPWANRPLVTPRRRKLWRLWRKAVRVLEGTRGRPSPPGGAKPTAA
jgi:lipopolysaccharide biosynthesis glycosyltransferase